MSEVDICNEALTEIGEEPITSLLDNSTTARLCFRHYPLARDELLASYRWNFCMTRIELVPLTDPPVYGFDHKFQLPADELRVWDTNLTECSWRIESGELLTDSDSVAINYSRRVTDTSKFSTGFRRCLTLQIAARLSIPLTRQVEMRQQMLDEFDTKLEDARTFETQESSPEVTGQGGETIVIERLRGSSPFIPGSFR